MAKRKTVDQRFAEDVREMGLERAKAALKLIETYDTKPEPKQRKKSEKPVALEAAKAS